MKGFRAILPALLLAIMPVAAGSIMLLAPPAAAQPGAEAEAPDYAAWEREATGADAAISDPTRSDAQLEQIRTALVSWREKFLAARNTNQSRIQTLQSQIDALGPPPAEGAAEAPEIAQRRVELAAQMKTLQAPGIAAEEAYSHADGMIKEIDRLLRERQADALMQLWPSPLNPANWMEGLTVGGEAVSAVWSEVAANSGLPSREAHLRANLPLIFGYLFFALVLLVKGRGWMERLTLRFQENTSARGRKVWSVIVSTGQVILPVLGMVALARAIEATGMTGPRGSALAKALPIAGFAVFSALWLAGRLFAKRGETPFLLSDDRRREARVYLGSFGLLVGFGVLLRSVVPMENHAVESALTFPILILAGMLLFRVGQILRQHAANAAAASDDVLFRDRLTGYFGLAAMAVGVAGPVLAAVGYIPAANALIWPAGLTLALMGVVLILQNLSADIYALIAGDEEAARDALVPVLVAFLLAMLAMPLVALIWGARVSDLMELWLKFRDGFTLAGTRISPSIFLTFAVVFAIGYTATKVLQGALRSTVLPKTRLDQGAQTAIVSGVGYLGIFLAALIAITTAGINLSSLAIVAGALSVGIGFGLQNIVQNFVSGIILLLERPVSEGDWIQVGSLQGRVRAISVRSTRIETFDRTDAIVPNADLITGQVINYTRFNLSGRLIVPVSVASDSDTRKVQKVLKEIAEAQPLATLNPPPSVALVGFASDAINFEIRMILRDVNYSLDVRTEVNHQIAERFAREGINMPYTTRDLWLRNPEALREALQGLSDAVALRSGAPAPTDAAVPGLSRATPAPADTPATATPADDPAP